MAIQGNGNVPPIELGCQVPCGSQDPRVPKVGEPPGTHVVRPRHLRVVLELAADTEGKKRKKQRRKRVHSYEADDEEHLAAVPGPPTVQRKTQHWAVLLHRATFKTLHRTSLNPKRGTALDRKVIPYIASTVISFNTYTLYNVLWCHTTIKSIVQYCVTIELPKKASNWLVFFHASPEVVARLHGQLWTSRSPSTIATSPQHVAMHTVLLHPHQTYTRYTPVL